MIFKIMRSLGEDRWARWAKHVTFERLLCPVTREHYGAGNRVGPLDLSIRTRTIDDFAWAAGLECAVSPRATAALEEAGLSGYVLRKAHAHFAKGGNTAPVSEFVVTGWGGVAPDESGIRLTDRCNGCGLRRFTGPTDLGRLVDESRWDGSDFFYVYPLLGRRFVSPRAQEVIRKAGLTGIAFIDPTDLRLGPDSEVGAWRLSYFYGEKRAKEIMERTGLDLD